MKTKDRRGELRGNGEMLAASVALTFRSAHLEGREAADLRVGATKLKERSGDVYENKESLPKTRGGSGNVLENKGT
jgi:hypothetical protein